MKGRNGMRRDDVLKKLTGQRPQLVAFHLKSLAVFGSETETVTGKIMEVRASEHQFLITSYDVLKGKTKMIQFQVDANTRYDHFRNLQDLKMNDLVSIDFYQNTNGQFMVKNLKPDSHHQSKKGLP